MRLIDVDSIKSAKYHDLSYTHIHPVGVDIQAYEMGWNDALDAVVESAPSVDAVEVVRCKDCKHKPSGTGVNHDIEFLDEICPCQCEDYWYSWMPQDNFFCAWGERREDASKTD